MLPHPAFNFIVICACRDKRPEFSFINTSFAEEALIHGAAKYVLAFASEKRGATFIETTSRAGVSPDLQVARTRFLLP